MALSEQNRWPKVSLIVFINTCMTLLLNRHSFPVAERTQIRWRTTCLTSFPRLIVTTSMSKPVLSIISTEQTSDFSTILLIELIVITSKTCDVGLQHRCGQGRGRGQGGSALSTLFRQRTDRN